MSQCPTCRAELAGESKFCSSCGSLVATVAVTDPPVPRLRPSELERRLIAALSGRYRIKRLLGQGGMGAVFLADDIELDRQVAIKVLPSAEAGDSSFVERFRREARTSARLDHPNIIPIYQVESIGDLHYFVMRYVPGKTLGEILADTPRLEISRVRSMLAQAARALGHAHQAGIVHRDVKPANIMVDADERVILTDFGISKAVRATTHLTNTGMIIGTPTYMAPEQGRGQQVDGRADQYALGVVGYQMVAGDLPFDSDDVFALMFKHMSEPPVPLATLRSDAPADLCRTIERALAKEPADRFASMEEFASALDRPTPLAAATAVIERPVAAKPARPAVNSPRRAPRAGVVLGGAGLAVVVIGLALTTNRPKAGLEPLAPPPPLVAPPPSAPAVVRPPERQPEPDSARTASSAPVVRTVPLPSKPAPPPPPAPPPSPASKIDRATVTIGVDGSYATVYIDNEVVGETPVVRELSFGEHEIRIEREGFKTIRQRVVVAGPMTRRFTLEPAGTP